MTRIFLIGLFLIATISNYTSGHILEPAKWSYSTSAHEVSIGDKLDLIFHADIDKDWYLYSSDFDPECGPIVTSFEFVPHNSYTLIGGIKAIGSKKKYDDIFECDYTYFRKKGEFRQTIKVLAKNLQVAGTYAYQVCTDVDGKCIPFDDEFLFNGIKVLGNINKTQPEKTIETQVETPIAKIESPENTDIESQVAKPIYNSAKNTGPILDESLILKDEQNESLLGFMILAFIAGLAALLTPCVFPMIPMTVSFFTNKGGKSQAILYGFSIIVIYTIINR